MRRRHVLLGGVHMRPGEVIQHAWRRLLHTLGGFGIFFTCVVALPFCGFLIGADPTNPKRWVGGALLLAFSVTMSRSRRQEEIKKASTAAARELARVCILRLRELPTTQRHVRDLDLDVLEAGLQEPPT